MVYLVHNYEIDVFPQSVFYHNKPTHRTPTLTKLFIFHNFEYYTFRHSIQGISMFLIKLYVGWEFPVIKSHLLLYPPLFIHLSGISIIFQENVFHVSRQFFPVFWTSNSIIINHHHYSSSILNIHKFSRKTHLLCSFP